MVPRGSQVITLRATDNSGAVQTGEQSDVIPDGATRWHSVAFTAT
jgi:hypothetical protein